MLSRRLTLALAALFLVFANVYAQPVSPFGQQWREVYAHTSKGRPKSALQILYRLERRAQRLGDDVQRLRVFIAKADLLRAADTEAGELAALRAGDSLLAAFREPAAAVLRSLLADAYQKYYERYRWQIDQRTRTAGKPGADLRTWDEDDFRSRINQLYAASLTPAPLLRQTPVERFDALVEKGSARLLRPTLYDLLVHRPCFGIPTSLLQPAMPSRSTAPLHLTQLPAS